jgi:hypothetical protein
VLRGIYIEVDTIYLVERSYKGRDATHFCFFQPPAFGRSISMHGEVRAGSFEYDLGTIAFKNVIDYCGMENLPAIYRFVA